MAARAALLNFSKGEIAPELESRFDVEAYKAGLRRARNVKIRRYGGVEKRMGTRLVAEAFDQEEPVRLIPFQFNLEQAYALEMGQGYMRPLAYGGIVLEQGLKVIHITKQNPAQIWAPYHGYSVGDRVYLDGIRGMTQVNGRFVTILEVLSQGKFTVDLDTRRFDDFEGSDGYERPAPVSAPAPVIPPVPPVATPPERPSIGGGGVGGTGDWITDHF